MEPLLLAVDGDNILHHAYHGNKSPVNEKGFRLNGVITFFGMINKMLRRGYYTHLVVAWDVHHTKTLRHKILGKHSIVYKNREANLIPEQIERRKEIHDQKEIVKNLLTLLGIPHYTSPHEEEADEADDILATIAYGTDMAVHIATNDKDMYQTICPNVSVYNHHKGVVDWINCYTVFGVEPTQIADYLALCGDSVDNIPGVNGVGHVTAVKLLAEYGNFRGVLKARSKIKGKVGKSLEEIAAKEDYKDYVKTIKRCVRLNYEALDDGLIEVLVEKGSLYNISSSVKRNKKSIAKIKTGYGIEGLLMKELDV